MDTRDVKVELSETQLKLAKDLANQVNSLPIRVLTRKKGHSLFELDLDAMTVTSVCSLSTILTTGYIPQRERNKMYCFKLNKQSAIRKFEQILSFVIQETK